MDIFVKLKSISKNAYSMYTKISVVSIVEWNNGELSYGVNVENATLVSIVCAEVSAISSGITQGFRGIKKIHVFSPDVEFITPCGRCRQMIWEHGKDAEVITYGKNGEVKDFAITELLPEAPGNF